MKGRHDSAGRRIQLYVSADIVQINNSSFFNESWPWQRWADWQNDEPPAFPSANYNASTLCHAFTAWQEAVARFTARVIEQTGVDGVRHDGLGGQFAPCKVGKRHVCNIYPKMINLPRQARDKHRENSNEEWRFLKEPFACSHL